MMSAGGISLILKEILNFICHTLGSQAFLSFSCICGLGVNLSICPCRKLQKVTIFEKVQFFTFCDVRVSRGPDFCCIFVHLHIWEDKAYIALEIFCLQQILEFHNFCKVSTFIWHQIELHAPVKVWSDIY